MAKTILSTTHARLAGTNGQTAAGATEFWFLGYAPAEKNATEANRHITYQTAGTVSKLYVRVITNSTSANSTVTVRKNGADTSLTCTVTAGTTGEFEDTNSGHDVTVAAGDELCYKTVSGGTGTFTFSIMRVIFNATTNCVNRLVSKGYGVSTASSTNYIAIAGDRSGTTGTEANTESTLKRSCTLKNAFVNVTANARTTNTTFTLRKNRADTAIVITYGNVETGIKEDTSNSISYTTDDELDWKIATSTGTQTLTFQCTAIDIETTTNNGILTAGAVGTSSEVLVTEPVTWFFPIGGGIPTAITTESQAQQKAGEAFLFRDIIINITATGMTQPSTLVLRVNGADSALTLSIPGSTLGFHANTTNTVTVAASDLVCLAITTPSTAGSVTMSVRQLSITTELADLTRVEKQNTFIYNIVGRTQKPYTYKYHIVGRVSKANTFKYHILTRVSKLNTFLYNIRARVSKLNTLRYNIIGRVSKQNTFRYNIVGRTQKASTFIYNISVRVAKASTFRYNLVGRVTATRTFIYNIFGRVQKPNTFRYNIIQRTSKANTFRYNVLQRVTKNNTFLYHIFGRVSKTNTFRYNIFGRVSKASTFLYNIFGRVSKPTTFKYNILGRVSKLNTFIYNIAAGELTRVSKAITYRYNIIARTSKQSTFIYNIIGRIQKPTTYRYHITARVSKPNTFLYSITSRVQKANTFRYNIIGRVRKATTFIYNIFAEVLVPEPVPGIPSYFFKRERVVRPLITKRRAIGKSTVMLLTAPRLLLINNPSTVTLVLNGPVQQKPTPIKIVRVVKRTKLVRPSKVVLSCRRLAISPNRSVTLAYNAVLVQNASQITLTIGDARTQLAYDKIILRKQKVDKLLRLLKLVKLTSLLDSHHFG